MAKLGAICELVNGYAFKPTDWSDEGLPIIRIQNLNDNTAPFNYYNGEIDDRYYVKDGDLLFAWSGTPGTSFGAFFWKRGKGILNQHIFNVYPIDSINKEYFRYALNGNLDMIISKAHGGVGLKHITKKELENIDIPLPPLETQRQIAANLDKVTHTIDLCNAILEKLDTLVKSRFVEMFGDIQKNDRNWLECPLGEICEKIVRYPTFYGMDYINSGTRVIRIGNILNDGHMDTNDGNYVFVYDGVNDDFPETVIEENDIVMAVRGDGSAAKRIGFITEKCLVGANISPNLIRIKADRNSVIPIFLFYYLTGEIGQKRLDAYVNKTAKKNIAAKDIVKVISPVPPLELQEQFAAIVEQTDKSKLAVKQVLEKAETLKKALMQEYFEN